MKAPSFLLLILTLIFIVQIAAAAGRKRCRKKCTKNEVYRCNKCPEATCGDEEELKVECVQICSPKQCLCKYGYARHNGTCILADNCPLKTITENGTTNYLTSSMPLSKVSKNIDATMPKIVILPPPISQED